MKKLLCLMLCLCLCTSLSACQRRQSGSSVDDSYLEGIDQGREDFFLDLWKSAYNLNTKDSGDLWETDDFSLRITAKKGQWYGAGRDADENTPYLEVDFTLTGGGTIESYYENDEILFCIYSYGDNGWSRVWDSYFFYDYFAIQDGLDGNKGCAEVGIYDGAVRLAVVIVINDRLYAAAYFL